MFDHPLWEVHDPEVDSSIARARRRASKEFKEARAKAFGDPSGDQQENDRRIFKTLVTAAQDVRQAEEESGAALAKWLGETGNTWPPTPDPLKSWFEKKSRFQDLLVLADQDPCFTFERLLQIGEFARRLK